MSKAFTKESDSAQDEVRPLPRRHIPAGVTNYITATGAKRLRDELAELTEKKRELNAAKTDVSGGETIEQRRVQDRIRQLQEILQSVVVADPPTGNRNRVGLGATVTVRDKNKDETTYRIVGLDEADPNNDQISWLSPLAKQLMGKQAGERVQFRLPAGDQELEILAVGYENS